MYTPIHKYKKKHKDMHTYTYLHAYMHSYTHMHKPIGEYGSDETFLGISEEGRHSAKQYWKVRKVMLF